MLAAESYKLKQSDRHLPDNVTYIKLTRKRNCAGAQDTGIIEYMKVNRKRKIPNSIKNNAFIRYFCIDLQDPIRPQ